MSKVWHTVGYWILAQIVCFLIIGIFGITAWEMPMGLYRTDMLIIISNVSVFVLLALQSAPIWVGIKRKWGFWPIFDCYVCMLAINAILGVIGLMCDFYRYMAISGSLIN
jgi:hypothetical protein